MFRVFFAAVLVVVSQWVAQPEPIIERLLWLDTAEYDQTGHLFTVVYADTVQQLEQSPLYWRCKFLDGQTQHTDVFSGQYPVAVEQVTEADELVLKVDNRVRWVCHTYDRRN